MSLFAHVTPHEVPLWIAALVAGIGLGMVLGFALLRRIVRKD
jgi:uncharacterized protein YqfA (UPF0365 family)